ARESVSWKGWGVRIRLFRSDDGSRLIRISALMHVFSELTPLNALSPLDGRCARKADALRGTLSEAAFMAHRVEVEIAWLIGLAEAGLPELPAFSAEARSRLERIVADFSEK